MLLATKTLDRDWAGDYHERPRAKGILVCGGELWEFFPLAGPSPDTIQVRIHDTPAEDRVAITISRPHLFRVSFDGEARGTTGLTKRWLYPFFDDREAIYAEIWY